MAMTKWLSNGPADRTFIIFCGVHLRINASNRLLIVPFVEYDHNKLRINGDNVI